LFGLIYQCSWPGRQCSDSVDIRNFVLHYKRAWAERRYVLAVLQAISKLAFDFERRKLAIEEVRELIYREILEYHPQVLQDYLSGGRLPTFLYPSAVDNFKRQFIHLEGGGEGIPNVSAGRCVYLLPHCVQGMALRASYIVSALQQGLIDRLCLGLPVVHVPALSPGAPGSAQPRPTGTNGRPIVAATSLPRERMGEFQNEAAKYMAARNGEVLAAQLAAQQQQQMLMQQQAAAVAAASGGGGMVAGRQQGSIPGNTAAMQQQQQLMAAMQQQQQHYAMEQYHQQLSPQDEEEAYRQQQQQQQQRKMAGHQQVDNLGSHVSTMTVMDCHNSSAVPMGYHSYAQQNPIYRSSSYQVQSIHRL
jgi:hypothetical protein